MQIDQVNWIPFQDRSSCMRRFEAKEVDICSDVAAEQMDYVKKNFGKQFRHAPISESIISTSRESPTANCAIHV